MKNLSLSQPKPAQEVILLLPEEEEMKLLLWTSNSKQIALEMYLIYYFSMQIIPPKKTETEN